MFSKCKRFDERAARGSSAPGPGNYNPIHRDTIGFGKKENWHYSKQRFNDSLGELRDCGHTMKAVTTMSTGPKVLASPPRKSLSVGLMGRSSVRAQDPSDVTQSATTFMQARSERWRPGAPVMSTVPSHVVTMAPKLRDFSLKHGPHRNTSIQRSLDRQAKTRLIEVPSSGYGRGRSAEARSASQWCSVDTTRGASQWCTSTRVSSRGRGHSMESQSVSVMGSPRVDPGTTGVASEANVHQSRIATEAFKRYRSRQTWSVAMVKGSISPSRPADILDPISEDGPEKEVVASASNLQNTRGGWDRPRSRGRMSSGSDSSLGTCSLTIVPETRTPPSERDSQLSDNETDSDVASQLSATCDVSLGLSTKSFNFTPLKEKKSTEDFNTVMDRQSRVKDTFVNQRCVEAYKQVSRGPRLQRSSSRSANTSLTRSPTGGRLMPPVKPTLKQLAHDRAVHNRMTAQRMEEQQKLQAKQRPLLVAKRAKKTLQKKRSKKSLSKRRSQKSLKASETTETHNAIIVKPVLRDTKIWMGKTLGQDSTEQENRRTAHGKDKKICEVGQQVDTCSRNADIEERVDEGKLDRKQSTRKAPHPQFEVNPRAEDVSVVNSEQHLGSRNVCADHIVSHTHQESTRESVKQSVVKRESNDLKQASSEVADSKTGTFDMDHADCPNGDVYYTSIPVEDIQEDGVGCKVTRLPAYNALKDKAFSQLLNASIKKQSFTDLKAIDRDFNKAKENATGCLKAECAEKQTLNVEEVISEANFDVSSEAAPINSLHRTICTLHTVLVNPDIGFPLNSYVVEKGVGNRHDDTELSSTKEHVVPYTGTDTGEVFESCDSCPVDEYSCDVTGEVTSDESNTLPMDRTISNSTFIVADRDSDTSLDSGDNDHDETTSQASSEGSGSSINLSSTSKSTSSDRSWMHGVKNQVGNVVTNETEITYETETFECGVEDAEDAAGSQSESYMEYTGNGLLDIEPPIAVTFSAVEDSWTNAMFERVPILENPTEPEVMSSVEAIAGDLEDRLARETPQGTDSDVANTDNFVVTSTRGNSATAISIVQEEGTEPDYSGTELSIVEAEEEEEEEERKGGNTVTGIRIVQKEGTKLGNCVKTAEAEDKKCSQEESVRKTVVRVMGQQEPAKANCSFVGIKEDEPLWAAMCRNVREMRTSEDSSDDHKMAAASRGDDKMAATSSKDHKMAAAVSDKSGEDNNDEISEMVSPRRGEQILQLSPQSKRQVRKSRSQRNNVVTATSAQSDAATSRRPDTARIDKKDHNFKAVAAATTQKEARKTKTCSELEREMSVIAAQRDALAQQLASQIESSIGESEKQQWLSEIAKLQQSHVSDQRELGDVRRTLDACTKKLAAYKNYSEVEKPCSVATLSAGDALRQVLRLQQEVEANKRQQRERRRQLESTLVKAQLVQDSLTAAQSRSSWTAGAHLKQQLEDLEAARANHKRINDQLEAQLFVKEIELLRAEEKMDARRVTSQQRAGGRGEELGGMRKRVPMLERLDAMHAEIDVLSGELSQARTQHTRVERRVEHMAHLLEEKVKRRVQQEAVVAELARTVASQERRPSYEHVGTGRWAGDVTALHVDLYHHVGAR